MATSKQIKHFMSQNNVSRDEAVRHFRENKVDETTKMVSLIEDLLEHHINKIYRESAVTKPNGYVLNPIIADQVDRVIKHVCNTDPTILHNFFNSKYSEAWVSSFEVRNNTKAITELADITKLDKREQLKLGIFDYIGGWCKLNDSDTVTLIKARM
jgi:hypothetical protein